MITHQHFERDRQKHRSWNEITNTKHHDRMSDQRIIIEHFSPPKAHCYGKHEELKRYNIQWHCCLRLLEADAQLVSRADIHKFCASATSGPKLLEQWLIDWVELLSQQHGFGYERCPFLDMGWAVCGPTSSSWSQRYEVTCDMKFTDTLGVISKCQ